MDLSDYFKTKRAEFLLFFLSLAVYLLTFVLWHLPLFALINATALVIVMIFVYSFFNYLRFRKEVKERFELECRLDELTKKVSEIELADKEQRDLMRIWSHQMKVPIAAMDLMLQTSETISSRDLERQLFALDNYLNMLLESVRIKNLSTDFRFEEVSLADLVRSIIKKYANFFIQKDLSVEIDGDWQLTTDRRWLTIALEQLVNNAVKYTDKGGLIVRISEGEIRLIDTGRGILPEDVPRLFEHGFTGYNGHLNQQKSTGLGLYLTKLIFDKLGFKAEVNSEVGKGTEIVIRKMS
ncbi:sensor histidine kinase [Lactococcus termiticola]|uniref:histidine kinase n=1 Tax=Lactococcus termiticola TaxID=2169526 RepID=A0A2R5HI58_9LACT|nr:sensor histidine kinase [Lactococcus termiticola]GBG95940.1 two-component system sensor histidine kinase [Lactococcus termiticola]